MVRVGVRDAVFFKSDGISETKKRTRRRGCTGLQFTDGEN
jgi:hypothetical protein